MALCHAGREMQGSQSVAGRVAGEGTLVLGVDTCGPSGTVALAASLARDFGVDSEDSGGQLEVVEADRTRREDVFGNAGVGGRGTADATWCEAGGPWSDCGGASVRGALPGFAWE